MFAPFPMSMDQQQPQQQQQQQQQQIPQPQTQMVNNQQYAQVPHLHANPYAIDQQQQYQPLGTVPAMAVQQNGVVHEAAHAFSKPVAKKRIRKLPPEKRQKVSTACDSCKKRKFKCTGEKPCSVCVKKGVSCTYTIIDKRSLKSERMAKLRKQQENPDSESNYTTSTSSSTGRSQATSVGSSVHSMSTSSPDSVSSTPPSSAASSISLHSHGSLTSGMKEDSPPSGESASVIKEEHSPMSVNSPLSTNGNTYIPKSLQPLLSFPLNDDKDQNESGASARNGISNQNGKCVILLNDATGTFRYMGETSPLSLLYETRNVFIQYVGRTPFTTNLQKCPVVDKPYFVPRDYVNSKLPPRHEADMYVEIFKRNINDSYFVLEMDSFHHDFVDAVYAAEGNVDEDNIVSTMIVYFVLALGALYHDYNADAYASPESEAFLKTGLNLLKDTVQDSELWVVQVHYLIFFYYQATIRKSTGWIHLNLAIKYAQSLGLHRNFVNEQYPYNPEEIQYRKKLFRSLYISDRIASIFIGRPLTINDYDWDDPSRVEAGYGALDFNTKAQIELSRITCLIGKIVGNFYRDRIIDIGRTKKLAVDLKLWSINLDQQLAIENIMKPMEIPNNEHHENTHILLLIHLLQLYAIMLLSRPFFMYEAVRKLSPELGKVPMKNKSLSRHFYQAAMKASILAIKLMHYYMNTAYKECMRKECYVVITCSFYASILIGVGIVNGDYQDQDYTEADLFNYAKMAISVLNHFGPTNPGADRYAVVVGEMIDALNLAKSTRASEKAEEAKEQVEKMLETHMDTMDFRILNDYNFIDDPNNNLQSLIEFQRLFVPQETAPTTGITSVNGDFTFTTMPHDYGNYELFFGDKY
ncbi:hypothetical protein G9P44_002740 [Scheffersomyces stipitis]|nr:hypothetical protein G9P44_002740 [Scheffersomyces stipitis]